MNGARKLHKPTGPAFAPGEQWVSVAGNIKCTIVGVQACQGDVQNYDVTYMYADGSTATKKASAFQVRYEHLADRDL